MYCTMNTQKRLEGLERALGITGEPCICLVIVDGKQLEMEFYKAMGTDCEFIRFISGATTKEVRVIIEMTRRNAEREDE